MALIDLDEFLVIRDATPDLPTLLHDYESAGALVVNWVVFGSSGQRVRTPGYARRTSGRGAWVRRALGPRGPPCPGPGVWRA